MTTTPADKPDDASAVDPGAIDLGPYKALLENLVGEDQYQAQQIIAAVEALRKRVPRGDGLPCVCRFGGQMADGRFDADMPIQECDLHKELRERMNIQRARAEVAEGHLAEQATNLTSISILNAGLRTDLKAAEARVVELAGALEEWGTPSNHRDAQWWQAWEARRCTALAATPAKALERVRALEEVVKAARLVAEARAIEVESTPLRQKTLRSALAKLDALGKE